MLCSAARALYAFTNPVKIVHLGSKDPTTGDACTRHRITDPDAIGIVRGLAYVTPRRDQHRSATSEGTPMNVVASYSLLGRHRVLS